MAQNLLDGFRLENCEVEPALGVLDAPGGSSILGPESMEVLVCLAHHAGKVVSREDIARHAWGDDQKSDDALNSSIAELDDCLRRLTGGTAYIRTVPGQGWSLVGRVLPLYGERKGFSISGFWRELNTRNVVRVSIAYWALVWAGLQSADFIFGLVPGIPSWATSFLIVVSIVGFPIVIGFAWVFRWTPEGLQLDDALAPVGPTGGRRLEFIIVGAAAIAVLLFFLGGREAPPATPEVRPPTSIAVLRFVNIGDDPENNVYSDGISDELLNLFANIEELRVPARESSWSLFGLNLDAPTIAERLNVEYFIEGSVRRVGERIRIMIQLIDAEGNHRWSKPYERDRNSVLDLPSNIAAEVVDELQVVLSLESAARLRSLPTDNDDAYIFYLRAREYLDRPRQQDNLTLSVELFDKALGEDPRFALAYAGLCEAHIVSFRRNGSLDEFEAAEAACHRASTLDNDIVGVHVALGNLYRHSAQYQKAEDEFRRAIELQPRLEAAHYGLARSLQGQGRLDEAERILRYCIELEPAYWGTYLALGNFLHRQGRYEEAILPYKRVTELTPENPDGYTNLGAAYYDAGDWEKAETAYRRSVELAPTEYGYQNLGTLYYYQKRYNEARLMHEEAVTMAPSSYRAWGKLASAARYMPGEEKAAHDAYQQAIELAKAQLTVDPTDATTYAYLASYYTNVDASDLAGAAIATALDIEPNNPEVNYLQAIVAVRLGNTERSLAALEAAVDQGFSLRLIMADPQFESLRDEARFKGLVARKEKRNDQAV